MSFIGISKAPEDPKEKDKWAKQMMRIHIANRYVGTACAECGHIYNTVDDFLRCNPMGGKNGDAVCSGCWKEYEKQFDK